MEDKKLVGFVTERIDTSLLLLINNNSVEEIYSTELEAKMRILQIAEVFVHLHEKVRVCHLGLAPENLYLCDNQWKLGGFTFSVQVSGSSTETGIDYQQKPGEIKVTPNIKFTPPEVVAGNPSKCALSSDIFSLACLIYTFYKVGHD